MTLILEIAAGIVLGLLAFILIYNYWQVLLRYAFVLLILGGVFWLFTADVHKDPSAKAIFWIIFWIMVAGAAWQAIAFIGEYLLDKLRSIRKDHDNPP